MSDFFHYTLSKAFSKYIQIYKVRIGECPSIAPFLENNGATYSAHILFKKVTQIILVYGQVQIIVAVTCLLYISYFIVYKE